ncbi:MAG: hypothetical protein ACYC27_14170 [Armatimonadota bacterium]
MSGLSVTIEVLAINAVMWIFILSLINKQKTLLKEKLMNSGENFIIEPESGTFRGSTGRFGVVKSMGVIALTENMIVFKKPFGGEIHLPITDIAEISENVFFMRSYHSGNAHLILKLKDGAFVGFIVKDIKRWVSELSSRMTPASS